MRLTFEDGTLLLRDCDQGAEVPPAFVWDTRVDLWRAQALFYRDSVAFLKRNNSPFKNTAPRYNRLKLRLTSTPEPHPHQTDGSATEGADFTFRGIPTFSPEIFKELINDNPMKSKQLAKGIKQLTVGANLKF